MMEEIKDIEKNYPVILKINLVLLETLCFHILV